MSKPASTHKPPAGISPSARAVWTSITADFDFDNAADLELLGEFVQTLDRLTAIRAEIKKHGITISGSRKQVRPHPLLGAENEARRTMLALHRALRLQGTESY